MAHLEECESRASAEVSATTVAVTERSTAHRQRATTTGQFRAANDNWQRFVAGGLSGVFEVACSHPLDLVKTLTQHEHESGRPASPMRIAADVLRREGLGGLYRGVGVRMLGVAPMRMVFWGTQSLCHAQLAGVDIPETAKLVIIGACAGTAQTFIDNPIEVLKIRAMVHAGAPTGPLGAVATARAATTAAASVTTTGAAVAGMAASSSVVTSTMALPKGLFHGISATLARNVAFAVLFAGGLYGGSAERCSDPLTTLVRGAGAGFTASIATQWLDYCKTSIQSPGGGGQTIRAILARTPIRTLWVGAMPRALLSMVTMSVGSVAFSSLERILIQASERRRR